MRALSDEYLISLVSTHAPALTVDEDGKIVGLALGDKLDVCDVLYTLRRASKGLLTLRFGELRVANDTPEARTRVATWIRDTFGGERAAETPTPDAELRRQAILPDAGRASLRLVMENSISPAIQRAWPVALPTRRLRERTPDVFFQHVLLDAAALCFDEPVTPSDRDENEYVLVASPGTQAYYVCTVMGRPRANKRARAECRHIAVTAAPPKETRGAFFWVYDSNAVASCKTVQVSGSSSSTKEVLIDVNIFPRRSDNPVADLDAARAAVDAATFDSAHVGVWLNATEAAYELEDAAPIQTVSG
jgi:hypothetical protein